MAGDERWRKIEQIYNAALERPASGRAAHVREACAGDEDLRREVESLLGQGEHADSFLEPPATETLDAADPRVVPFPVLGHFRLIEKIGAGGMGQVYKARDEQLHRDAAIKLLPAASFRDPTARARLLHEARTASKLNHPHICTIYEVGESDGQAYIAMELLEGQALSTRLAGGALPPEEVLRYGKQLADALAHAHQHGVIHRDLKSANVVITLEGRAKILDFGLAKRLAEGGLADGATQTMDSVPEAGTIVGTLAYMAPEELRGQPADARSDVWALGVVLYEMATGRRPFQGRTGFELSSAILNQPPPPLEPGPVRALPPGLDSVIAHCLEKDPARRYQRSEEVRAALEVLESGTAVPAGSAWKPETLRRRSWALTGALTLVIVALVAFEFSGLRERLITGNPAQRFRSLAVLPVANLSGNPEQEYFADGMTDALITDISKIGALKVISRTSVMQYKGTRKPLPQIARDLKVDTVLEASVLRESSRVRVTAKLIEASTEQSLWAESYEREMTSILALQSDVAQAVARTVRARLAPQEQARLASARQVNPEAYDAYLKGRFHWYKLSLPELKTALEYFQLALQKDPNCALAYVGVADSWMALGDAGFLPPGEAQPKARSAALKALELDDALAEAHVTLANISTSPDWDWPAAEKEFRRAIELNPSHANAHLMYADFLITLRRTEEWQVEIRRTLELDPLNSFFPCFYGWHLVYVRRYDEAIEQFRKVLTAQPDFSSAHLGFWGALYKKGLYEEAQAEARKFFAVLGDSEVVEALNHAGGEAGYRRAMRRAGDVLAARSERTHVPAVRIARVYAHAGENEKALRWLERAYGQRETPLAHIGVGWDWDNLRGDPRFQDLLRRMNLPMN